MWIHGQYSIESRGLQLPHARQVHTDTLSTGIFPTSFSVFVISFPSVCICHRAVAAKLTVPWLLWVCLQADFLAAEFLFESLEVWPATQVHSARSHERRSDKTRSQHDCNP